MSHSSSEHMFYIPAKVTLSSGSCYSCGYGLSHCCNPSWRLWTWSASVTWTSFLLLGHKMLGLWAKWCCETHWALTQRHLWGRMLQAGMRGVPLTHAYILACPADCSFCCRRHSYRLGSSLSNSWEGPGGATWKCRKVTPCRKNFDQLETGTGG